MNQPLRQQIYLKGILICISFILMSATTSAQQGGGYSDEYGDAFGGMGMEGMGGYSEVSPLETKIAALGRAKDDERRQKLLAEIKSLLDAQYDVFIDQNKNELDQMEARLEGLRSQLKLRREAKTELVDLELKRISNQAKGLAWPTGQSTPSNGSLMDGMMGMGGGFRNGIPRPGDKTAADYATRKMTLDRLIVQQKEMVVSESSSETQVEDSSVPKVIQRDLRIQKTLEAVALAAHNYEANNLTFPTNIVAKDGTPLLSLSLIHI